MKLAYLIIAHNELRILNQLIKLLDWPENSIYIILDSKSSITSDDVFSHTRYSPVNIYRPGISIAWGGSTMIDAELYLLKKASLDNNDYYCLLSGVDLPIKTQRYIHKSLEENIETEYVGVNEGPSIWSESRYKVYHPLQNTVGRTTGFLWLLERAIVKIQKPFVNRCKKSTYRFAGGPQWFCITDSFCHYILRKEGWIKRTFCFTECCDEVFIQTLLVNSEYYNHIYKPGCDGYEQCRRLIEFNNDRPYIWQTVDYDRIMKSGAWFARKFSESIDRNIVIAIADKISSGDEVPLQ